jgi:replication initiation protein RepC
MDSALSTTPFGRRPVTLGHIARQIAVRQALEQAGGPNSNAPAAVNKWQLFRTLTQVRARLGVSDRTLGVLHALLSFHQETALTLPRRTTEAAAPSGEGAASRAGNASSDLVVFPSNQALSLRAHGMAPATLRRHLAALVDAGLIERRDSPNGKRYARKAESGQDRFADAFGFDLTPLVVRAAEFEALAEVVAQERRAVQLLKERITLVRRDIAKLVECGLAEGAPADWEGYRERYRALLAPLRGVRDGAALDAVAAALASLRTEVANALEAFILSKKLSGNDAHFEHVLLNDKTEWHIDFEPSSTEAGARGGPRQADQADSLSEERRSSELETKHRGEATSASPEPTYSLGLVLEACPDVRDYAPKGAIRNRQEFIDCMRLVRPMLGVSPDAWRDAVDVMGEGQAAVAIATILQRSVHSSEAKPEPATGRMRVNGSPAITSPGGYLRALTERARAGALALGPVLMALIGQRQKARRA